MMFLLLALAAGALLLVLWARAKARGVRNLVLAFLLSALPCMAILGVGDIVHDPISYINALAMFAELVKSYEQLRAQLELASRMSQPVPVDMQGRYQTIGVPWYDLALSYDRFRNLEGWRNAVNTAGGARAGYEASSIELKVYSQEFARLAIEEQKRVASLYATEELADSVNIHSMETVGTLRANAEWLDRTIQALEGDSLSDDPAFNTEVAVLNKINAANLATLRSIRDANRLQLSMLEQQLVEAKRRRESEVAEINAQSLRLSRGPAVKAQYVATLTQSLQSFRWR